jgi:hypothetical protein
VTEPEAPGSSRKKSAIYCAGKRITAEQMRALGIPKEIPYATAEDLARWHALPSAPRVPVPWRRDGSAWHAEFDRFIVRAGEHAPHFWLFIDLVEADADAGYACSAEAARFELEECIRFASFLRR